MKIGDKVRFLHETGGGFVRGFQGKNIVIVEDEDGFEIPMLTTDVVVIGEEDYNTGKMVTQKVVVPQEKKPIQAEQPPKRPVLVEERKGGNLLSAYLAFVPIDIKEVTNTRFECYLVNDCNYYMRFCYYSSEGNSWSLRATGELEPNTKEYVEELGLQEIGNLNRVAIQIIAYKRDKPFSIKPAINALFRIDGTKFYRLHTFQENDYFEQPALLYTIVEQDHVARSIFADTQERKISIAQQTENDHTAVDRMPFIGPMAQVDTNKLVVNLLKSKSHEAKGSTSAVDQLNQQLEIFRKVLSESSGKKGLNIIFIHGKGEAILRRALINELQYRHKSYVWQDASFQEYGYGAIQITIK